MGNFTTHGKNYSREKNKFEKQRIIKDRRQLQWQ